MAASQANRGAIMVAIPEPFRDPVLSLPPGMDRPKWSVMVPTHNCAHYLRATLEKRADAGPWHDLMQIAVVDDASVDDPESIVREVGGKRVEFTRQPRNVGHIAISRAAWTVQGVKIVHLLHGDDLVRPAWLLFSAAAWF